HSGDFTSEAATDFALGGIGFFYRRTGNNDIGNVAADSTYAGWVYDSYYNWAPAVFPVQRGVDKSDPGQGYSTPTNAPGGCDDNEAYGMSTAGLWAAYPDGRYQDKGLFEEQTVTVDLTLAEDYTLSWGGHTTASIHPNSGLGPDLQAALNALDGLGGLK